MFGAPTVDDPRWARPRRRAASSRRGRRPSRRPRTPRAPGRRLPSRPWRNGSGKAPTIAGARRRLVPGAVVPLHAVPGRELVLGGALARLHAVHEEEPVLAPAGAARPPGRRSTARSARRSGCPRRTPSAAAASRSGPRAPVGSRERAERPVAEVARHAQLHAVALELLPRPEAAAGERGTAAATRAARSPSGPDGRLTASSALDDLAVAPHAVGSVGLTRSRPLPHRSARCRGRRPGRSPVGAGAGEIVSGPLVPAMRSALALPKICTPRRDGQPPLGVTHTDSGLPTGCPRRARPAGAALPLRRASRAWPVPWASVVASSSPCTSGARGRRALAGGVVGLDPHGHGAVRLGVAPAPGATSSSPVFTFATVSLKYQRTSLAALERELVGAHLGRLVVDLVEPVGGVAADEARDPADEQAEVELVADGQRPQRLAHRRRRTRAARARWGPGTVFTSPEPLQVELLVVLMRGRVGAGSVACARAASPPPSTRRSACSAAEAVAGARSAAAAAAAARTRPGLMTRCLHASPFPRGSFDEGRRPGLLARSSASRLPGEPWLPSGSCDASALAHSGGTAPVLHRTSLDHRPIGAGQHIPSRGVRGQERRSAAVTPPSSAAAASAIPPPTATSAVCSAAKSTSSLGPGDHERDGHQRPRRPRPRGSTSGGDPERWRSRRRPRWSVAVTPGAARVLGPALVGRPQRRRDDQRPAGGEQEAAHHVAREVPAEGDDARRRCSGRDAMPSTAANGRARGGATSTPASASDMAAVACPLGKAAGIHVRAVRPRRRSAGRRAAALSSWLEMLVAAEEGDHARAAAAAGRARVRRPRAGAP